MITINNIDFDNTEEIIEQIMADFAVLYSMTMEEKKVAASNIKMNLQISLQSLYKNDILTFKKKLNEFNTNINTIKKETNDIKIINKYVDIYNSLKDINSILDINIFNLVVESRFFNFKHPTDGVYLFIDKETKAPINQYSQVSHIKKEIYSKLLEIVKNSAKEVLKKYFEIDIK